MIVVRTGKTTNVRLYCPKVYFDQDFEEQKDNVHIALLCVKRLRKLIDSIEYDKEYKDARQKINDLYHLI